MKFELGRDRLGSFSFRTRRWIAGCAALPFLLALANHYLEWELFGTADNWATAVSALVLFLVARYLGPTGQQYDDYRRCRREERAGRDDRWQQAEVMYSVAVDDLDHTVMEAPRRRDAVSEERRQTEQGDDDARYGPRKPSLATSPPART